MNNYDAKREKAIEKLRKIKVLVLEGVGGEKTGAQTAYENIKAKFKITDAEIEEKLPPQGKRKELSFAMAVLAQQIHEEHICCNECTEQQGSDFCTGCGTYGNIRDLELQYEHMAAELEGRQHGEQ